MSNFNVLNSQHVLALSIISAEAELFNTISRKAQSFAESLGLVPSDLDTLKKELANISGLVLLGQADQRFANDRAFQQAVTAGTEIAFTVAAAHQVTAIMKERGLLFVNDNSELVYSDGIANDSSLYHEVMVEAFKRVEADINANNNNEDDAENEQGGAEALDEQAGSVGEEQEEAGDGNRDVPVSASLAA
jgi:hypothetical protein